MGTCLSSALKDDGTSSPKSAAARYSVTKHVQPQGTAQKRERKKSTDILGTISSAGDRDLWDTHPELAQWAEVRSSMEFESPEQLLNDVQLTALLGSGGYGVVFKGEPHTKLCPHANHQPPDSRNI